MDLNDMRKKFREKKAQKEVLSTSPNVEDVAHSAQLEEDHNSTSTKSGEPSTVSLSEISYSWERGDKYVTFSCSRLDNSCDETTGLLSLCCWISEKTRENDNWQNDNFAFVDSIDLGVLEKGYGFPDINQTFEIPDNLLQVINDMNKDEDEWHFVFTINELHEDSNRYIIYSINGENENEVIDSGIEELESVNEENVSYNTSSYYGESIILSRVKGIVANTLSVDSEDVVEGASFKDDLGADSLDLVELLMEFEKEFDIKIPDEIAAGISTIGDAVRLIEEKI